MTRRLITLVSALVVVAACSSPQPETTTTDVATAPTTTIDVVPDAAGCRVVVTGSEARSWEGLAEPGAFTTDFWWSDDALRDFYEGVSIQGDPTFEELKTEGYSVLTFFLMRCIGPEGDVVAISISELSLRTDIAMGPGTFQITGSEFQPGHTPAGEFEATYVPAIESLWRASGIGTLVIETWTATEVVGTFSFPVEERFSPEAGMAEVSGGFRFVCEGDPCG